MRLALYLILLSVQLSAQSLPDNIDISSATNGVIAFPQNQHSAFNSFTKYTKLQAPNGQAIHIMAQSAVTEAQIVRARNILKFYLTDYPGSQYGQDKSAVFNQMAVNDAMLMLLNGSDGDTQTPDIPAQPLYQNEMAVEGHNWYINNNYEHRDAAYEEILHLMHDTGIGVDGSNTQPGALPAYQAEIRAAQDNADNNFAIWPLGATNDPGWYNELAQENSLSQEYLASVVDSYYGLWGPWTEQPGYGMWGEYISQTRSEITSEDPLGATLMPKYFSPYININMDIDPSFTGTFSLTFNSSTPYTHKSQYLQHVTLTGSNASSLKGNDIYNRLIGNNSNNSLEGGKGNDRIDGGDGTDTAIFSGPKSAYTISLPGSGSYTIVSDNTSNRDGADTLYNIEFLQFSDETVANNSALPVSWGHIEAAQQKDQGITVRWSTHSEINNDYFILQKSNKNGQWSDIHKVWADSPNTTSVRNYQVIDKNPIPGYNYYRILQKDLDGSVNYSHTFGCQFKTVSDIISTQVIANDEVHILNRSDKKIHVGIYDLNGRVVLTKAITSDEVLKTDNWRSGIYIIVFSRGKTFMHSEKVLITK